MPSITSRKLYEKIMAEVEGCAISTVKIHSYKSFLYNPMKGEIEDRIKQVPVYTTSKEVSTRITVSNKTQAPIDIKSIMLETNDIEIHYPNITILTLFPYEEIDFEITVNQGKPMDNVFYRTVETVIMKENGDLEIIPIKPYTREWILQEAEKLTTSSSQCCSY